MSDDFKAGARAMFDALLMRAANNWHSRPEVQDMCAKENKLIQEWAEDALDSVSPDDLATWKSLDQMYQSGYQAGKAAR